MPDCRLLLDSPADGAWNMAVDEVLLMHAAREGGWSLRFYAWSEATVSLGYFQPINDRQCHAASKHCPVVRRPSGGGAIVHDRELTYSLAAPIGRAADAGRRLYRLLHAALAQMLYDLGIEARLCPAASSLDGPRGPFLCFQRRADGDVLLGNAKLIGSAQRRFQNAVLQHGSLLLDASPAAPELPGVESLSGVRLTDDQWRARVGDAIAAALELRPTISLLTDDEHNQAQALSREKYGHPTWTCRK